MLKKHYSDRHNEKDHGKRLSSHRLTSRITDEHIDKWLQFPPGLPNDYKDFVVSTLEAASDLNDDANIIGLTDNTGIPQAIMLYSTARWKSDNENDLRLQQKSGIKTGDKVFLLQRIAVAPWHHRSVSGRIKGLGTELMARMARHVSKKGYSAVVLQSKDAESDKFYSALGMTQSGREFFMLAEDARKMWKEYENRLRQSRAA